MVPGGVAAAALLALTLVAYVPALQAGFIVDDDIMVTHNRYIRSADGLYYFWLTTKPADYFPLTSTTLWLEWRLWGTDATGYHLTNLMLHAVSAVVIWRVLRRLDVPGAYVAAAIFAVHPVTAASVVWISERKNTLSMLLFSLSMLTYLRFEDNRQARWYIAALAMFLLALLAKTSVVMMPVVLLVLAWWKRGRITRADVLRTVPFFAASLVLGLVTMYYQYHQWVGPDVVRSEGFLARLAASAWSLWFYVGKTLLPIRLSMVYPSWDVDPTRPLAWGPLLGLTALAAVAWRYRGTWGRPVLAALGYFVAMLLPVLGFLNMAFHDRFSLVSDHLQYVALIAPIALVVATGALWLGRARALSAVAIPAIALVLITLCALTWQRALVYGSQETLWRDTVRRNPEAWMAHYNLGAVLAKKGQADSAMTHYREALQAQPEFAEGHSALGDVLASQGRLNQAVEHYRQALQIAPDFTGARCNLGVALASLGRFEEAIDHYQQALETDPENCVVHYNLANALAARRRLDEAITHYRRALEIRPDLRAAQARLDELLAATHK